MLFRLLFYLLFARITLQIPPTAFRFRELILFLDLDIYFLEVWLYFLQICYWPVSDYTGYKKKPRLLIKAKRGVMCPN